MPRRLLALVAVPAITALALAAAAIGGAPDATPPVVTVTLTSSPEASGPGGALLTYDASAVDDIDGPVPVDCSGGAASGTTVPVGTTVSVSCTATDAATNMGGPEGFSFTAEDTIAPTLSGIPADQTVAAGEVVTYTDPTASDAVDPNPTVSCVPASGFTATATVTVSCTATDTSGNTTSPAGTFTVTVTSPPDAPPTLILPGSFTIEATGATTAIAYSASATDPEDDPDPPALCSPSSGTAVSLGTTTVSCSATDSAGNVTSDSFTVTVADTTDPVVTVPGSLTVEPTGPAGAVVTYSGASAVDLVSGSLTPVCSPASGSLFSLGAHVVTCTATDGAGNSGSNTFGVSVQDADAPVVTPPPTRVVEANGPTGSIVTFSATAVDAVDGPRPVTCAPASGSRFAVGSTSVSCTATDLAAPPNVGSAVFTVIVQDTVAPVLTVPGDLVVVSATPVPATSPAVAAFLSGAIARDIVDAAPKVTTNAPATFPLGATTVTFTATDKAGNKAQKSSRVTVTASGTPPATSPDRIPPGNVRAVKARPGNLSVLLSWKKPTASDLAYVEVTRSPGRGGQAQARVYRGLKTSFRDKGLANGIEYRYLIVAYDRAGNRAAGVAVIVVGRAQLLLGPADGARLAKPPRLSWKKVAKADYYNVQVYRKRKIDSRWPTGTSLQMVKTWTFEGRRYTLGPGCYEWWVWPGFGAKAAARYGDVLGHSRFCIKAARRS